MVYGFLVRLCYKCSQISGFLKQLYLETNLLIQHDFLHSEIDWQNVKGELKIIFKLDQKCSWRVEIAEFLEHLYFNKKDMVNQPYILLVDGDSRKVNGNCKFW